MNKFSKIFFGSCALVAFTAMLGACSASEDGPSVDDYYLNYDIPEVKVTEDYPVGAFYYNVGTGGLSTAVYNRLVGDYDPAPNGTTGPQLCPKERPVLGRYNMNLGSTETVDLFQQHINWAQDAGIDFLVLPNITFDATKDDYMGVGSINFYNYMEGYSENSMNKINWGKLRLVPSMTMDNFVNGLSNSKHIEDVDVGKDGKSARLENLYHFFVSLADRFSRDSLAYRVDGKLMIVIYNPHRLYCTDSHQVYQNIRDSVYKYTNTELFLVARQQNWSPSARYHDFFLTGGVDAVYLDNMYDQTDFSRKEMYPVMINENYKYNRNYIKEHYNIDFIPNISPSFVKWVGGSGTQFYNTPPVYKNEDNFRTMCNVAKLNAGDHRIIFIDSFNDWSYDRAIEPTDPNYGNGYGMKYLQIVRQQFKVN